MDRDAASGLGRVIVRFADVPLRWITGKPPAKSQLPARDCHVGLRPPRNDKSEAITILTAACTGRQCSAGRGMPLPYKAGTVDDAAL